MLRESRISRRLWKEIESRMTQGEREVEVAAGQRHKKRANDCTCIETYCMPDSELNLSICLFHANVHTHTQ